MRRELTEEEKANIIISAAARGIKVEFTKDFVIMDKGGEKTKFKNSLFIAD